LTDLAAERARIARELHDGIAQNLAAIGYSLDAEIGRSDTNTESRSALRAIREEITSLNATMRQEIFKLRKIIEIQPQQELLQALQSLPLDFEIEGELSEGPIGQAQIKVLVELARNAVTHSGSRQVKIEIFEEQILFTSQGEAIKERARLGFGLQGAAERLAQIDWEIEISEDFSEIRLGKSK
jgi:signal transduction histidine kinase